MCTIQALLVRYLRHSSIHWKQQGMLCILVHFSLDESNCVSSPYWFLKKLVSTSAEIRVMGRHQKDECEYFRWSNKVSFSIKRHVVQIRLSPSCFSLLYINEVITKC
ncbi:hypothetical protein NECAME_11150 [Necator americanus]|uniref:Uncharacterized protein n=1 Tax=Necator americanus TaxID=51031 RepID=W2T8I2_NECAM|nr:hypothetical protein NECAME_11150 [Necator americanus]ETN77277.1 hypothetical protein NECAME_11150 [Necator americanus]